MKLYFSPGACSLAPHILLREIGAPFDLEQVDNKAKRTKSGADFWQINPKGYVPVLELDDGRRITEAPAVLQYIADHSIPIQVLCRPAAPSIAIASWNG
jgi:glutathione S-transferase